MSCHLSITSVIPCCIRDHSPKSDTAKTASSVVAAQDLVQQLGASRRIAAHEIAQPAAAAFDICAADGV